jgi:dTDP-4-dehydrorhamnose reductase
LSREIARATVSVLSSLFGGEGAAPSLPDVSGTYHMTAGGETNWCDFASAILEKAKITPHPAWLASATGGLPIITRRVVPISTSEFPTPARRPAYSVLSNAKLNRVFSVQLPDWRKQLDSLFANPPA